MYGSKQRKVPTERDQPTNDSSLSICGVGEIKYGLIAAAWGALYKLTSDLTQYKKFVKMVLKSPNGSVQLRYNYNSIPVTVTIYFFGYVGRR